MASYSKTGIDLNLPLIRDNLSCIGKHPFSLSHAYLAMKIIGKNIGSIEIMKEYPNLMYIDLSDNFLVNLQPLENLVALVELKARSLSPYWTIQQIIQITPNLIVSHLQLLIRNNLLKDCLAFSPKRCSSDSAWPGGQKSVGSLLAIVDLTGNQIEAIHDLLHHRFLECLILSSNEISKISGLESLKYLQVKDGKNLRIKYIDSWHFNIYIYFSDAKLPI